MSYFPSLVRIIGITIFGESEGQCFALHCISCIGCLLLVLLENLISTFVWFKPTTLIIMLKF